MGVAPMEATRPRPATTEPTQPDPSITPWALAGPLSGQKFVARGYELFIGRSRSCAVVLPLAKLSRRHARIVHHDGHFLLSDLRPKHATQVNGETVRGAVKLRDGDRVAMGG